MTRTKTISVIVLFMLAAILIFCISGRFDAGRVMASNKFSDVDVSDWYYDAVGYASEKGFMNGTGAENKIVSGYSETVFGADDPITREQLAAITPHPPAKPVPLPP